MSEFYDIIKRRKMVRQYIKDKPIPQEIVDKLISNAHRAPSAGHTQVQEFIIVQDPLIKKKLGEAALNQEQNMMHLFRLLFVQILLGLLVDMEKEEENFIV